MRIGEVVGSEFFGHGQELTTVLGLWPRYQPKVTTLKFVLVRVIALKLTPTLNTVYHDKYKALVLKNTARLMLVVLLSYQLTIS